MVSAFNLENLPIRGSRITAIWKSQNPRFKENVQESDHAQSIYIGIYEKLMRGEIVKFVEKIKKVLPAEKHKFHIS